MLCRVVWLGSLVVGAIFRPLSGGFHIVCRVLGVFCFLCGGLCYV
jgi:hypothetical protein